MLGPHLKRTGHMLVDRRRPDRAGIGCVRPMISSAVLKNSIDRAVERLAPSVAINRWPDDGTAQDPSVAVAYQALWHFEADEDKQRAEVFYMDAQLELMRQMAVTLGQGRPLPAHMLSGYNPDWQARYYFPSRPFDDVFRWCRDGAALLRRTWHQAFALLRH